VTFTTKPAVAPEMLAAVVKPHGLRCRWGVAEAACGGAPGCLDGVAGLGRWSWAAVSPTTRVWQERPATRVPPWRGRGRRPQRERLVEGAPAARTVREVAATLPAVAWARQTIKEGSPGPRVAEVAAMRVSAVRDTLPGPDVWVGRRRHRATGALPTSLWTAPRDTALATACGGAGCGGPSQPAGKTASHGWGWALRPCGVGPDGILIGRG